MNKSGIVLFSLFSFRQRGYCPFLCLSIVPDPIESLPVCDFMIKNLLKWMKSNEEYINEPFLSKMTTNCLF